MYEGYFIASIRDVEDAPLSWQSRQLSRRASLIASHSGGGGLRSKTERADPEVPEPVGETGGFCEAKDEGRVRVVRHFRKLLHR